MGHRHTKCPQQTQYKNKCMKPVPQCSSNCRLYSGRLMQVRNMGSTPNKMSHTLSHLVSLTVYGCNYLPRCSIACVKYNSGLNATLCSSIFIFGFFNSYRYCLNPYTQFKKCKVHKHSYACVNTCTCARTLTRSHWEHICPVRDPE